MKQIIIGHTGQIFKKKHNTNTVWNHKGNIMADATKMTNLNRQFYEELHTDAFENAHKMGNFLGKYGLVT